jgi:hypothetical protein
MWQREEFLFLLWTIVQERRRRSWSRTLFSWLIVSMCWHHCMSHSASALWLLIPSLLTGSSGYYGYQLSFVCSLSGCGHKPLWHISISLTIWTVSLVSFPDMGFR